MLKAQVLSVRRGVWVKGDVEEERTHHVGFWGKK